MYSIETDNLTKKYKDKTVVDKLNLKIKDGELFALLGTNGAGKTTTIKMLTGLVKPTKGKIKILNLNLENNSQKIKTMLNISPQETAIAPNLTVKENLEFFAGVYQIKDRNEKIEKLVKDFKLEKVIDEKAKKLSGGWQRRLSIALALINGPKILFLDEPTLGLDVIARKELWRIIEKLKGKVTIILTTHYMEEAEALSDRIGIMKNGRVIATGTAKSLMKQAKASTFEDAFVKIVTGEEL
ncbi:ABC transporter ATP-binding protein [Candidatus Saccharibacteria bacterium]|nr:ABC transporter ATP-binding protein [Candidatus Saccharibacteria bacterium]